jgi:hypothetical protein
MLFFVAEADGRAETTCKVLNLRNEDLVVVPTVISVQIGAECLLNITVDSQEMNQHKN